MTLELALRATGMLLGWAFLLQSMEHLSLRRNGCGLFMLRAFGSALLLAGVFTPWACLLLLAVSILLLVKWEGPYNGGSDRMGLLILFCLSLAEWLPQTPWREAALGYLAVQLLLSYFMAGWVKIVNPEWRGGRALRDVFLFSAYPASEDLRALVQKPRLLRAASWAVMLLELAFPFSLMSQAALMLALTLTALFHLANVILFGLNRFFWIWLAAYPSLLWLQHRLFG